MDKQDKVIKSLDEFKAEILKFQSEEMVYRGQSDAKWDVISSAYRRLKLQPPAGDPTNAELLEYNKNLIKGARRYPEELKETTTDLNLLAKLQHDGVATSLIDFTEAALVALWFACQDKSTDGKIFCLDLRNLKNLRNLKKILEVSPEDEEKEIETILTLDFREDKNNISSHDHSTRNQLRENIDKVLSSNYDMAKWKPSIINNRILKQDSFFIFNKESKLNDELFKTFILCKKNKGEILKELKQLSNFSEETLFPDFRGFVQNNGFDKPYGPQDAEAYFRKGNENFALGKYKDAIEDYNKVIELDPQIVEVYYIRGLANYALGKFEEAIEDYDKAVELDPQRAEAYCGRGFAKYILGNGSRDLHKPEEAIKYYKRGIKDYNKAIELDLKCVEAYNNRGIANRLLGNYEEAIEDYNKAIKLNPQLAEGYSNRGNVNFDLKNYKKAIEDYNKAIELDSQDTATYLNRGNANHALENYEETMKNYTKAKKLFEKEGNTKMVKECEEKIEELQKT